MTKCPRCHEEQPDGTKFCMSCGARLSYEQKKSAAPPVDPSAAFAPTLASEIPTKPGTATPSVVPQTPAPVSVGTTPPPFSASPGLVVSVTPPLGSKSAPPPVVSPSIAPGPAMARPSSTAAPVAAAAAVEDKSIVVTAVSGKLVGLDARSGSVVWEHAIDNGTPMLLIGQGLVLAAVGQSLYCCDYKTGRPMWRAALSAYAARITMIFEGEHVYAFGAGVVDAFDRVGRRVWTRPILPGANASGAIGVPGNVSQADRE